MKVDGRMSTVNDARTEADSGAAAHETLIDDFYRKYILMVLYARKGAGTWSDEDELMCFTVYLNEPAVICVNDEPHGWTVARALRSFVPGEQLAFADLQSDQVPRPEHRRPYFSAARTPTGWVAESDFSSPHPASSDLLAGAAEFLTSAEQAHQRGALRAFVENAFHAAESLVKVELLSYPVAAAELEGSRKHPHVQSVYACGCDWATRTPGSRHCSGTQRAPRLSDLRQQALQVERGHRI